jgi:hypothetical protein
MKNQLIAKYTVMVTLITMAMLITACGSGGGGLPGTTSSGSNNGDPNGAVAVANLTVTGTGTSNGTATIDPNTNSGKFTISFSTSGPGAGMIYIAEAYVNLNGNYNGGTTSKGDYRVGTGCGATTISDSCHNNVTYTCSFNTSNVVSCVNQIANAPAVASNIQQIMTAVPQNAYVVAYVCNGFISQCTSLSVPVIFQ